VAAVVASVATPAMAQPKEQFFPLLVYRTGAYAPNGVPFANGYADYLKLVNARGGINGVKVSFEECETGYATDRGVECYERLKGKNGGATVFQPLSTGITFALTESPGRQDPLDHRRLWPQRIGRWPSVQVELPADRHLLGCGRYFDPAPGGQRGWL
jgi:branched-chain amino acid transport system substrate-binding protein